MTTMADFATYEDFPIPGVLFYDISPILADPQKFRQACDSLIPEAGEFDLVVGIDARGFIFAPVVAQSLNVGLTMVRKSGKMPGALIEAAADKEYGSSDLVLSAQGIEGKRVLVVDDVLATGGTARAVAHMLERAGAVSVNFSFLLELPALSGREVLSDYEVISVVKVPSSE